MVIRAIRFFFFLTIWAQTVAAASPQLFLPDGSVRPGAKITIPAGEEKELLFQRQGVRFLAGKALIRSVSGSLIGPDGQEIKEMIINAGDRSHGIPWMHDEKPFRLRIRAETDCTVEARESWEWDPERDLPKSDSL